MAEFLRLNDGSLHYEVAGTGPAILLIHGGTLDMSMWDDQFKFLTEYFEVIRYDIRGYGKSPAPSSKYFHFNDIKFLLSHLGIQKLHLVGLSLGGGIAINFALTYPEFVSSIVTLDSTLGGYSWDNDMMAIIKSVWMNNKERSLEETKELWINSKLFDATLKNRQSGDKLREMIGNYSGFHWKNIDTSAGLSEPAILRLKEIQVPLLSVVGELDMLDYHHIADLLSTETMNGEKRIIKGAGHMVNLEYPEIINKLIKDFILSN